MATRLTLSSLHNHKKLILATDCRNLHNEFMDINGHSALWYRDNRDFEENRFHSFEDVRSFLVEIAEDLRFLSYELNNKHANRVKLEAGLVAVYMVYESVKPTQYFEQETAWQTAIRTAIQNNGSTYVRDEIEEFIETSINPDRMREFGLFSENYKDVMIAVLSRLSGELDNSITPFNLSRLFFNPDNVSLDKIIDAYKITLQEVLEQARIESELSPDCAMSMLKDIEVCALARWWLCIPKQYGFDIENDRDQQYTELLSEERVKAAGRGLLVFSNVL